MPADIVLRNAICEVGISRADARIVSWVERATGEELLKAPMGVRIEGTQPDFDGFIASVEEAEEGHEALLYDPFGHGGRAVQVHYRLRAGRGQIEVEVQVSNRRRSRRDAFFYWLGLGLDFGSAWKRNEEGWHVGGPDFQGRQSKSFQGKASPFWDAAGEVTWSGETLSVRIGEPVQNGTLFLRTSDGRTVEAPISVFPERALTLPLNGLEPAEALLRDGSGRTILQTPTELPAPVPHRYPLDSNGKPDSTDQTRVWIDPPAKPDRWHKADEEALALAADQWGTRHLVAIERARRSALAGHFDDADAHLETALLYNGDDPLVWWQKAAVRRHIDPEGERTEWLNARFLRPLEPLVAAEAILAQDESRADNPLVELVAGRESFAVECVLAYEGAGLIGDASTLAHRILDAKAWPRVRAILGGLYLESGRMDAEAARLWQNGTAPSEAEGAAWPARERELRERLVERFGA